MFLGMQEKKIPEKVKISHEQALQNSKAMQETCYIKESYT
jgi:hypothetical protein